MQKQDEMCSKMMMISGFNWCIANTLRTRRSGVGVIFSTQSRQMCLMHGEVWSREGRGSLSRKVVDEGWEKGKVSNFGQTVGWATNEALIEPTDRDIPATETGKVAGDYWREGQGRDRQELKHYLPPQVLNQKESFILVPREDNHDRIIRMHTRDGQITAKSA